MREPDGAEAGPPATWPRLLSRARVCAQALARAAKSYLQLGRLSDARRMYGRTLEVDPRNAAARAEVSEEPWWLGNPARPLGFRADLKSCGLVAVAPWRGGVHTLRLVGLGGPIGEL